VEETGRKKRDFWIKRDYVSKIRKAGYKYEGGWEIEEKEIQEKTHA